MPDALTAVTEVNAPVFGVVAPTVPLMLMLAVPVRLVTVPDKGVPRAPPLTTNAPAVPVLTPSAVTTPLPVVIVDGATPAPPPTTKAFEARAAELVIAVVLEKYGMPPEVPDVMPVPPLGTVSAVVKLNALADSVVPLKVRLALVAVVLVASE